MNVKSLQHPNVELVKYKLRQSINYGLNQFDFGKEISWVYIYGHHRGGTSYTLNQFLKASRRGCGDWMLYEFAEPFSKAENRKRSKLNMQKLRSDFRKNLLKNASVGGGSRVDITIKQATGRMEEIEFLSEIFKAEPVAKIFVAREPHGWWSSAKKKFEYANHEMIDNYCRGLDSFFKIGGHPILYGPKMCEKLSDIALLKNVQMDEFFYSKPEKQSDAMTLEEHFNKFCNQVPEVQRQLV